VSQRERERERRKIKEGQEEKLIQEKNRKLNE
jgi:hypothetical protein